MHRGNPGVGIGEDAPEGLPRRHLISLFHEQVVYIGIERVIIPVTHNHTGVGTGKREDLRHFPVENRADGSSFLCLNINPVAISSNIPFGMPFGPERSNDERYPLPAWVIALCWREVLDKLKDSVEATLAPASIAVGKPLFACRGFLLLLSASFSPRASANRRRSASSASRLSSASRSWRAYSSAINFSICAFNWFACCCFLGGYAEVHALGHGLGRLLIDASFLRLAISLAPAE